VTTRNSGDPLGGTLFLGSPSEIADISEFLRGILKELKIEKQLSSHSFRHTFASLLLADRTPVPEVSHRLGHKNPKITMETYAHFIPEEKTTAIDDFSASILSDVSTDVSIASGDVRLS
jgi:integrase